MVLGRHRGSSRMSALTQFVMKEVRALDDTLNLRDTFCADIRYADDTTLISAIFDKLKISTKQLNTACKKWGMKINGAKCNIISPSPEEITIDGAQVEHVGQFTFLGSVVPHCSEDVNRRISLAAAAFGRLRTAVWNRREIGMALKVRLYNALILPLATYAAETWTLKAEDTRKLEAFEMRCLRGHPGSYITTATQKRTCEGGNHSNNHHHRYHH